MTKFGTFDDILNMTPHELKPIAQYLRNTIFEIDPNCVEVVRIGDRGATFGVGPKKMSEGYCYLIPYKNWINLGFYKGTSLPDPNGYFEGTGKNMRHIKMRSLEQAEEQIIRTYIQNALEERKKALNN